LARSGITDLVFADASTLLVADQSGTIEQWDLAAPDSFGTPVGPVAEAQVVAVAASGDLVAVGGCDAAAIVDLGDAGLECSDGTVVVTPTDGGPRTALHPHRDFVDALTFTADGSAIISGGRDGTIVHSELSDGASRTLVEPGDSVTDVALSPDGTTFAASNFNGAVTLTSLDTGRTDVLLPPGDTRAAWRGSNRRPPSPSRRMGQPSTPDRPSADSGDGRCRQPPSTSSLSWNRTTPSMTSP
jgi:WD40 repeat protein